MTKSILTQKCWGNISVAELRKDLRIVGRGPRGLWTQPEVKWMRD